MIHHPRFWVYTSRIILTSMPSANKKIIIQDLTVKYGKKIALRGLTLEVYENEILGIIGPAQSGKTSLLRVINRTIDFTPGVEMTGSVVIDGEDVLKTPNVYALRRKIGMVAPLPVGLPLSIYDNVAFAPRMAGTRKRGELDEIVER